MNIRCFFPFGDPIVSTPFPHYTKKQTPPKTYVFNGVYFYFTDAPAVFSIVERLTGYYLTIRIQGKTTVGVADAMQQLHDEFGEHFSQVFRTITTDNGSEFAAFSDIGAYGAEVYFAHPYSSWERSVNERSNRILRRFIPKGVPIRNYTDDHFSMFADEINAIPRKPLGYRTAEELFDEQLDLIYQI